MEARLPLTVSLTRRRSLVSQAFGVFFQGLALSAVVIGLLALVVLLVDVLVTGLPHLDWQFLNSYPSRFPERAGIKSALAGTAWLMVLTAALTVPLGVGTAVWLSEYAPNHWFTRLINLNIANLAGVPGIVYGLLGLALFVRGMELGRGVLAGALTVGLLVLPTVVVAAREALRAVPDSLRHASYALGASRWQTVSKVVLPTALPGILTGVVLALSRAIGEAAPLIIIGALTFVAFVPKTPMDPFTVLPIQIFNWTTRPQEGFRLIAAAGIIVLLAVLLLMNSIAIWLRNRYQRKAEW
ncbi:MAG: phosphate ABC transporter permease PstA [Dehalococcoidia bacterium]|nr:phosphate ABC transporter permease PstA [Dehalococcoidia bacterium]MDW8120006.1 phosphate ABC transporter permease PstA [Chloroflexota bacterium]